MSAQEIIAELPKLNPDELRLVKEKLRELDATAPHKPHSPRDPFLQAVMKTVKARPHWPADYALNHGHYVSGEPRKS